MTDIQNTVLADINTIMVNTSLTEPFHRMILLRLESLGYSLKEDDAWSLCFAIQSVETHVKNSCNILNVPESAYTIVCDMVCGEFLTQLFNLDKLEGFDVDKAVQSVHLGDTTVTYADSANKVSVLLNHLIHSKEGDLICYRRMKW